MGTTGLIIDAYHCGYDPYARPYLLEIYSRRAYVPGCRRNVGASTPIHGVHSRYAANARCAATGVDLAACSQEMVGRARVSRVRLCARLAAPSRLQTTSEADLISPPAIFLAFGAGGFTSTLPDLSTAAQGDARTHATRGAEATVHCRNVPTTNIRAGRHGLANLHSSVW